MEGFFYHGSNSKIEKFLNDFHGKVGAIDAEGPGTYFTNSKENAAMWGKLTYTVSLNPRKVITNTKPANKANRKDLKAFLDMIDDEDYANNWSQSIETDKLTAINEAIKSSDTEYEVWHSLRNEQYNGNPLGFMKAMSKLGYDAQLLYKEGFEFSDVSKVYHCVVYNKDIVKIIKVERNSNIDEIKKIIKKAVNKILNEQVLYETALGYSDLPEQTGAIVKKLGSGTFGLDIYNAVEKQWFASIFVVYDRMSDDFSIGSVTAMHGFGPLIYEMAMMYCESVYNVGLMPDRTGTVSDKAFKIWEKFFYNRTDVEKEVLQISDKRFSFSILPNYRDKKIEFGKKDKIDLYSTLSSQEKEFLRIFNTAYHMKPNAEYKKLIDNGTKIMKSGLYDEEAMEIISNAEEKFLGVY